MSSTKEIQLVISSGNADTDSADIDPRKEQRLLRKCDIHVVPILFVLYAVAFLDRINIGNATTFGMQKELHMKGNDYNVALLVFFVPYILLEVPSNMILKNMRPSTWLSATMFCWGIATMCQGLTKTYAGLVGCRALIGVFEAGLFPGSLYLMSMYYKRTELQKRWTVFFTSGLVAGAFGGLLAFALAHMNKLGGYSAWRWIFIIEGLLTIVVSVISKFVIVDWPEECRFLSIQEKALLLRRLEKDRSFVKMDHLDKQAWVLILTDWKIWVGILMYMGVCVTGYSTAFFIPTILTQFGYSPSQAQVHTIPIYAASAVVTLTAAFLTDRLRHRYSFTIAGVAFATIGYIILLNQSHLHVGVKYMAIYFVVCGAYVTQPIVMVWVSNNMGGHYKRAAGSAFQIGLGNIGGIIGSTVFLSKQAPRYPTGYGTALGLLLFCGLMCTVFYFGLKAENARRDGGARDHKLQMSQEELENLGDDHPNFRFNL